MTTKMQQDHDEFDQGRRLEQDLEIAEAMALAMEAYLDSESLFYPLDQTHLPRVTLGGYLLRQHRLQAVVDRLDTLDQDRLATTMTRFRDATVGRVVRVETRSHDELRARLRQWEAALEEMKQAPREFVDFYPTTVQTRAIMAALLGFLQEPPFELEADITPEAAALDHTLANHWTEGEFVWPPVWQPAYPPDRYWWLYGRPQFTAA